jgi:TRAP-type mannitol/chloroaromatic compound transport system permease small subunit
MQEAIWYLHGILFMVGAGFTLMNDGHVRVDVFYREASPRFKALVDLWGSLVFLLPLCILTFWLSFSYVVNSWTVLEGSTEVSGLPFIYILKTTIWAFSILLGLQAIALIARATMLLRGQTDTYSAGLLGPKID